MSKYIGPILTSEFEFFMILVRYRCATRDTEHQWEKLDLARLIASHISNVYIDALCIEVKGNIKKKELYFLEKLWWIIIHYKVSPTSSNNIMKSDKSPFVTILMGRYYIDFVRLIRLDIHIRCFCETTTLLLSIWFYNNVMWMEWKYYLRLIIG